ncbi:C2H2-type domain-containing protein [Plasmodiophora brassicae]|uniref:C2H2-type domain-containing protein n=1 Tax=Plasmodiophora brassicae TaxID=37360 RepID=A0A3P3YGY3_PLABS|nr:unnamed protein product [Plasmodiophora brassicae]
MQSSSDHRITLDALPGSAVLASTPAPPSTWLYTAPSPPGASDDPPTPSTRSVSLQALFGMYDARLLPYVDWLSRNGFARVDHVGALTPDERRSVYGAVRPPIPYSLQLRLERLIRTAMGDPLSHSQRHAETQTCDPTHVVVVAAAADCVDQATQWADPDAASSTAPVPGAVLAPDDRPAPSPTAAAVVPGEGADGLYSCPVCAAMFTRQDALTVHHRAHTGARPFVCARPACGKGFRSRTCLQRHERGHVDERQFVCALCGKAFKTVDALAKHRKVHTQDKAHQCDICRRSFRRKDNLAAHRLIHTRAYPCDLCDQTFRWKSGLAAHRRAHADSTNNEVPNG